MQQKLAVASVLLLALLAGASVALIQTHAFSQYRPSGASQASAAQSGGTQGTNSTSGAGSGGSLLVSGHPASGGGDDGNETELEGGSGGNFTSDA